MQRAQGFAEQGARVVWTAGQSSQTLVQESAPFAMIQVYVSGTTTLATLYADNNTPPTPLANPFTANEHGYWWFYAADGRYDVMIEAPDWTWTKGDITLQDVYSWSKDVNANGHNLLGLGTLQANSVVTNSLTASGGISSPSFTVQNCITFSNAEGWMSICIDQNAGLLISNTNQPVMRITQQGFVGIGLVIPQAELEVFGLVRIDGLYGTPTTGQGLELGFQPSPNYLGIVQAYDRNNKVWLPIVIDGSLTQLNPNSGGNVTMCLQAGNVGVGTGEASPQAKVEIAGTVRISNDFPVPGAGQGLELAYQTFPPLGIVQAYDRTAGNWIPIVIDGIGVDINSNTTGDLQLCRGGGKVGIGGAFGQWRLDVNGDINCSGQFRVNGTPVALGLEMRAAQDALEARVAALEAKVK